MCNRLLSINLPSGLRSIGGHAFAECRNLASLIIPSSVVEIGDYDNVNDCMIWKNGKGNISFTVNVSEAGRYVVGLKENRWALFGLKSQRQLLLSGRNMIDVVISDVSSHGALVTGEMVPSLVAGKEIVQLQVKFDNPQETIMLPALVVRVDRPIPKIAQYALSFIEPVSISWMRRVDEYAMKLKCD